GRRSGPRLLEGLAASGLRSIRYALEVPELGSIDANDMDRDAVAAMGRNVALNGPEAAAKIRVLCSDARLTMLQNPAAYDIVDLDPYGTPAGLLDSALQAVSEGGLLMVTATDMANLCGNNSTNCWSNYGAYPVHRSYCHEMALRIVLGCMETHAARPGRERVRKAIVLPWVRASRSIPLTVGC
ncbi:putative tRNA (guanine(26)-N(2))-dimethyltransferase 2, partial [Tetrabaena socialis]